jgi:hypothetical protein
MRGAAKPTFVYNFSSVNSAYNDVISTPYLVWSTEGKYCEENTRGRLPGRKYKGYPTKQEGKRGAIG